VEPSRREKESEKEIPISPTQRGTQHQGQGPARFCGKKRKRIDKGDGHSYPGENTHSLHKGREKDGAKGPHLGKIARRRHSMKNREEKGGLIHDQLREKKKEGKKEEKGVSSGQTDSGLGGKNEVKERRRKKGTRSNPEQQRIQRKIVGDLERRVPEKRTKNTGEDDVQNGQDEGDRKRKKERRNCLREEVTG